jgi:AraC-like DNA-binding protein
MPSLPTPFNTEPAAGPRVGVSEWHCPGRQSSWADEYQSHGSIELPLLGLDLRAIRGRQLVVDPGMVVLHAAGEEFRVASPTARPRRSTSLTLPHELLDELAPDFAPGALRSSARTALLHQRLRLSQRSDLALNELAGEELALMLVQSVLTDARQQAGTWQQAAALSPAWRRLADELSQRMALDFDQPLTLETLAQACGASAFHASRVFRRVTGQSIHRHLNQLRLRAALFRLPDMRGRLTELALDSGFSSHSHFSSAFKAEFACAPAAWTVTPK